MFSSKVASPDKDAGQSMQQSLDNRFSLVELRRIHAQLVENRQVTPENQNLVVEILRVLAEMVVYGDRKSELLFDYFCEKNMLQLFLEIMRSEGGCPSPVHVQILQTLSILISSVKNDTSLYYLLSNNHINDVIVSPHDDIANDESLAAQYVSFIKTLSLRLNEQTVQFFFIEDTGAFPILTKSVEMMKLKDPMVRIAAQSAILNVYKVSEKRSRQFSLRPEVMVQLFQAIVHIMVDQIDQLGAICSNYGRLTLEGDDVAAGKLEQTLGDAFVMLEDWLYYVQDLLSLKIDSFNKALIKYVVDDFVCPVLLKSLLHFRTSTTEDGFLPTNRVSSVDVEDAANVASKLTAADAKPVVDMENAYSCVCLAYLLQMLRIIGSSAFTEAVMVGIFHPLELECRQQVSGSPSKLVANPYRNAFFNILKPDSQRLVLLGCYVVYSLCGLFREQRARELSDAIYAALGDESHVGVVDNSKALADRDLMQWMEVLHLVPPGMAPSSAEHDSIIYAFQQLDNAVVRPMLVRIGARRSEDFFYIALVKILKQGQHFSLTTVQAASFSLSLMLTVMSLATGASSKATSAATSSPLPELPDSMEPSSPPSPPPPPSPQRVFPDSFFTNPHTAVLKDVREACRSAAQALLARLSSSLSEVLLVLINEETKRFAGRQWRLAFQRMSANKLLFLPPTAAQLAALGIDFDLPISQTESLRKEVQIFLLLRGLFKLHLHRRMLCEKGASEEELAAMEDLSSFVQDKDLLCLEDANMLPPGLQMGASLEMKGRKFLDAYVSVPVAPAAPQESSPINTNGGNYSFSSSLFSLGWSNGNARRSSAGTTAAPGSPHRGPSANAPAATNRVKMLFVQDPQFLILSCQDKSTGKSVFRVNVLAQLLYTDAKVDLLDRRKLKLLVRSWKPMPNMNKLEIEFSEGGGLADLDFASSITSHSSSLSTALYGDSAGARRGAGMDSYLKPCEKSQLWQIVLMMDTEQACTLAAQHIEARRKAITAQKVDRLRSILSNWALDAFDVLVEAEMQRS